MQSLVDISNRQQQSSNVVFDQCEKCGPFNFKQDLGCGLHVYVAPFFDLPT